MSHEFLLHTDRSTDRIQPSAMSVAERVRTDVTEARLLRSPFERVPDVRWGESKIPEKLSAQGYLYANRGSVFGCFDPIQASRVT